MWRERLAGAALVGVIVLFIGWPLAAVIVVAEAIIPWWVALGAATATAIAAFVLDTWSSRGE